MSYPQIIVSLTTFPARIEKVHLTIQCLLRQTYPNLKTILWLSKEQFPAQRVPQSLESLKFHNLEIRFVDGDIRSHKKYYYTFQEYNDSLIFLADDDIIYPSTIIEESYKKYMALGGRGIVVAHWGYKIGRDSQGCLTPYNSWNYKKENDRDDLFFGTGGGTLLRPSELYGDVCNKELFMSLTRTADDIWINAMCKLAKLKIHIDFHNHLPLMIKNNQKLTTVNTMLSNMNDIQLANVSSYYLSSINQDPFALII